MVQKCTRNTIPMRFKLQTFSHIQIENLNNNFNKNVLYLYYNVEKTIIQF